MSRKYDPTKVRRHWFYDRKALWEVLDIHDNTITNLIASGLAPIDEKRPQVFSGHVLQQFLARVRWRKGRPPENGRLYCFSCVGFKQVKPETLNQALTGIARYTVTGECIDCHNMLHAVVKYADLPEILKASHNSSKHSSDVCNGLVPGGIVSSGASVPPETHKANQRWLYRYMVYLRNSRELKDDTIDEHLRAVSRMSNFFGNKPFEKVTIQDVIRFKNELRRLRDLAGQRVLSRSTVVHTLDRCGAFFRWLSEEQNVVIVRGLPGYFNSSTKERASAAAMVKEITLTFEQAICIFNGMPQTKPIEIRNRALLAMFMVTGMRISALISLRGKHVNMQTRWINQDPQEVNTKQDKFIRTYCLDLGHGLLEAIRTWAKWRTDNGFGDKAAFFLPDRYIQHNSIGLGCRLSESEAAECWKSDGSAQQIIKDAALAVGIPEEAVSSHDFRKILFGYLAKNDGMSTLKEVALQLNFGQTPTELLRKHYASMRDSEREMLLNELCRHAVSYRSDVELFAAYISGKICESDPDRGRAEEIFRRYS